MLLHLHAIYFTLGMVIYLNTLWGTRQIKVNKILEFLSEARLRESFKEANQ